MQGMAQSIYNVFVRQDGSYGVALSQLGTLVRTATGFAAEVEAREWIERDRRLYQDERPSAPAVPPCQAPIDVAQDGCPIEAP
jgi:hypothetical protein